MAEIESGLDAYSSMIAQALHRAQTMEIEHIGELIRDGLDTKDLLGATSGSKLFAYRNQLREKLIDLMTRAGDFGKAQVKAELARQ